MNKNKHWLARAWRNKDAGGEGAGKGGQTNLSVPPNAFRKIKDQAFKKGQEAAHKGLDDAAKAAGFKSIAEALGKLASLNNGGGGGRGRRDDDSDDEGSNRGGGSGAGKGRGTGNRATARDVDRERADLEKRLREEADERIAQVEAMAQVTLTAIRAGIDPDETDYAVSLLTRHVNGMSEADAMKVDTATFFKGLRAKKPHLFVDDVSRKKQAEAEAEVAAKAEADKAEAEEKAKADKDLATENATTVSNKGKPGSAANAATGKKVKDVTEMNQQEYAVYCLENDIPQ